MVKESSLTAYVARFVVDTKAREVPRGVMHLGKRSILDGLGLALAGCITDPREVAGGQWRAAA